MWWLLASATAGPLETAGVDLHPLGPGAGDAPTPVVGGQDVEAGDWPDAAALYTIVDSFGCTGVLVAPDVVLTAGHCGYGLGRAILGTVDHRSGGVSVDILEAHVHPDPYRTFDVTALILEEPVTSVAPRPLLLDCLADQHIVADAEVTIVGHGATDEWGTEFATHLQEAFTTIRDPACTDFAAGCNDDVSPAGELIAGGDGIDSCLGDSGGPLYLSTGEGDFLVGLTSRAALPVDAPCGGGGIYVRADAIADWIEEVTGRVLPRPDCEGQNRAPSPTAGVLEAPPGAMGVTRIDPNDPNADDVHTYTIVEPPEHGEAQVFADGTVTWRGRVDTMVWVRVTDAEGLAADIPIEAVALPGEPDAGVVPKGGCQTAPGLQSSATWLKLLARRR